MSRKEPVTPSRYGKIFTVGNAKESTPNSLRKRVMSKGLITKSNSTIDEIINKSTNDNVFNTAFSQTSSGTKTRVSVNRNRSKSSTALNACYTPTSLYRSAGSTPGPTPNSAKSKVTTPANSQRRLQNGADMKTPECYSKVSLETPGRRSTKGTNNDESRKEGEISNLSVAVRVRPLNTKECLNSSVTNIVHIDRNELTVLAGTTADSSAGVSHSFHYDHAFWSCNTEDGNYAHQDTVFRSTAQPLVEKAFEGYNACLFAYGQTGSGKSYSMMGIETDDKEDIGPQSEAGIIPRFCQEIFRKIRMLKGKMHAQIEVSYFEIYNEKIHDLLSVTQIEATNNANSQIKKNPLKVREHPIWGPYVVDLSTHPVDSYVSLRNWLAVGNSQRATAATGMNDKSSRSHSIFNIILNLTEIGGKDSNGTNEKHTKRSKISLVDLAGSERVNHTCASGERLREGVSINKSLLTLGKVIAALADTKKGSAFVPYRESVLTWLLRENLGGNSRTVMLATISPASIHIDETLATLRYACQARTIVNRVKVNEDPHDRIIRELRAEVERLQALRQDYERQKRHSSTAPPRKIIIETSIDETEVEALRVQLAETEKELAKAQKSWMERLKEAEDLRKSEMRLLKRKGLALELSAEQKQACLINLAADPILSGTLLYILPFGTVRIGRSRPTAFSQPDIVLEGPLVAFNHCTIENTNGKLVLIPENSEFETYVNGELILEKRDLFHGDRVVIGGSHYFRVSNPFCSKRHRSTAPVDYQTAHQEILQKQEEELRQELEQEKQVALRQIEEERAENERNYKEKVEMLELEKFKYNCSKELLETEKKAFKDNSTHETFQYTPYKSTLLEDIKRIMQNPSKESLHKTQLKVKEATQRCRDIGINLEFKQTQVADEFGIFRAIVNIIDRKTRQKAEWPTARLDVWLELIRENEVNKENIFNSVDIEWSPLNESLDETLNDSLNSSRISLNLSSVKDAILRQKTNFQNNSKNSLNAPKSPQETKRQNLSKATLLKSVACKNMENTKKMLTYEDDDDTSTTSKNSPAVGFNTTAYGYLKDIQRSTLKLKRFCESFNYDENSREKRPPIDYVMKSVDQLEEMIYDIKIVLTEQKMTGSPPKTPKSVRFLLD